MFKRIDFGIICKESIKNVKYMINYDFIKK